MACRSILAAASFVALAAAGPQLRAPPVVSNAQIGQFHLPITCDIYGSLTQTFDIIASGEAPAYAANGAEYYVTDVAGTIGVPANVVALARQTGASSANANITIYINATNASPASVIAYQGVVPVAFPDGQSTTISFPANNGTIAQVGPFTVGSGSEPSLTKIGNTVVSLELLNAAGASLGFSVPVACGKQNIDYVLTSLTVDNTVIPGATYNAAPANGYVPDFPKVPIGNEFGFFKFPYNCLFGPLGANQIDLTIGGQLPIYLTPGQSFSLQGAESFLDVPASLVKLAKTGFPTVTNFFTEVSAFELDFTNTSPASVDVAGAGPLVSITDVTNADTSVPLSIPIPPYFPLTVGPVAAGSTVGNRVSLSVGNATAYTALRNANNEVLFSFNITCSPYFPTSLISIPITDQKPSNFSLGTNNNA